MKGEQPVPNNFCNHCVAPPNPINKYQKTYNLTTI